MKEHEWARKLLPSAWKIAAWKSASKLHLKQTDVSRSVKVTLKPDSRVQRQKKHTEIYTRCFEQMPNGGCLLQSVRLREWEGDGGKVDQKPPCPQQ